ncbi:hypothetical protein LY78DRAFT_662179 [Colletotrichum sublineola]|uniref:Uncharacterized protein n=1 Tax=Colletotrichum sublineola TaxID=1173701 RepID=A0A066XP31_COLSU|nr:hypothetical protein LY78DRAFT_662179 [Colletotrichum sublineola]KDN69429.1 hypothetical protein CSUB01_05346 [Colletotrichum sublineola]
MKCPTPATTISLVLLALAQSALGCSTYTVCHCYNASGAPNDNATQTVCSRYEPGLTAYINRECHYIGPEKETDGFITEWYGMDNCEWRDLCKQAGATGPDSSCREKVLDLF